MYVTWKFGKKPNFTFYSKLIDNFKKKFISEIKVGKNKIKGESYNSYKDAKLNSINLFYKNYFSELYDKIFDSNNSLLISSINKNKDEQNKNKERDSTDDIIKNYQNRFNFLKNSNSYFNRDSDSKKEETLTEDNEDNNQRKIIKNKKNNEKFNNLSSSIDKKEINRIQESGQTEKNYINSSKSQNNIIRINEDFKLNINNDSKKEKLIKQKSPFHSNKFNEKKHKDEDKNLNKAVFHKKFESDIESEKSKSLINKIRSNNCLEVINNNSKELSYKDLNYSSRGNLETKNDIKNNKNKICINQESSEIEISENNNNFPISDKNLSINIDLDDNLVQNSNYESFLQNKKNSKKNLFDCKHINGVLSSKKIDSVKIPNIKIKNQNISKKSIQTKKLNSFSDIEELNSINYDENDSIFSFSKQRENLDSDGNLDHILNDSQSTHSNNNCLDKFNNNRKYVKINLLSSDNDSKYSDHPIEETKFSKSQIKRNLLEFNQKRNDKNFINKEANKTSYLEINKLFSIADNQKNNHDKNFKDNENNKTLLFSKDIFEKKAEELNSNKTKERIAFLNNLLQSSLKNKCEKNATYYDKTNIESTPNKDQRILFSNSQDQTFNIQNNLDITFSKEKIVKSPSNPREPIKDQTDFNLKKSKSSLFLNKLKNSTIPNGGEFFQINNSIKTDEKALIREFPFYIMSNLNKKKETTDTINNIPNIKDKNEKCYEVLLNKKCNRNESSTITDDNLNFKKTKQFSNPMINSNHVKDTNSSIEKNKIDQNMQNIKEKKKNSFMPSEIGLIKNKNSNLISINTLNRNINDSEKNIDVLQKESKQIKKYKFKEQSISDVFNPSSNNSINKVNSLEINLSLYNSSEEKEIEDKNLDDKEDFTIKLVDFYRNSELVKYNKEDLRVINYSYNLKDEDKLRPSELIGIYFFKKPEMKKKYKIHISKLEDLNKSKNVYIGYFLDKESNKIVEIEPLETYYQAYQRVYQLLLCYIFKNEIYYREIIEKIMHISK